MLRPMTTEQNDEQKVWEAARYFAGAFGSVPNSFSTTIRTLLADHQKNPDTYSNAGRFLAARLIRSSAMQSRFFYAVQTFFPERALAADAQPTDYLSVFKPYEVATIFGIVYAYTKLRKRCDKTEFGFLSKNIQEACEIGGHLGRSIPKIGFANGILAGTFSLLSICPFMLQDLKGYKEYKKKTKPKGMRYNLNMELEQFYTTHAHVCSWLIPPLGFGVPLARPLTEGFLGELNTPPPPTEESYKFYIAMIWIESLLKTGNPPDITHKGGFYPMKDDMEELIAAVAEIQDTGSKHNWLEKVKEDAQSGDEALEEEIPEEIRKQIQD